MVVVEDQEQEENISTDVGGVEMEVMKRAQLLRDLLPAVVARPPHGRAAPGNGHRPPSLRQPRHAPSVRAAGGCGEGASGGAAALRQL